MDPAYISTLSALGGSLVGGMISFLTAWTTQHSQAVAQRRASERTKREELYGSFIDEISLLYSEALANDHVDFAKLVSIYAKRGRIELVGSRQVSDNAERALQFLLGVYTGPNRKPEEVASMIKNDHMDPVKQFASVCRVELQAISRGRFPD